MNPVRQSLVHVLTVDVEDWYTGIPIDRASIDTSQYRLRSTMDVLLEILDGHGVRGTFFWLGELAEEYPDLVKKVHGAGHRIGCHGWSHTFIGQTPPELLKKQLYDAKGLLEDIIGTSIQSFRAPFFSISRDMLWVLDMLVRLGFTIDSSIFPGRNWRYGIPGFPGSIRKVRRKSGNLWLAPITMRKLIGTSIPISGGAYLRLYPYSLTRSNFRWAERQGIPAVFYIHPWELDPDHPRRSFDIRARLTHYTGLSSCRNKLDNLLREFRFGPLEEVVETVRSVGSTRSDQRGTGMNRIWDHGLARRTSAHVRALASRTPMKPVLLDIGCREGKVLGDIARILDADVSIGIDLECDRFLYGQPHSAVFVQADGESIPLRDGTVDIILCTSTLKHIWDADKLLKECARVLVPGGLISIVDVTPEGIRKGIRGGHLLRGSIQRILDLDELSSLVTRHGFNILYSERFMLLPIPIPGAQALEAKLLGRGLGHLMLYQLVLGGSRLNQANPAAAEISET